MRRCLSALLVVGLISVTTREAAAQPSAQDVAAYLALNMTPVGALTPMMVSSSNSSFALRYSRWQPESGDANNNFGASYYMPASKSVAVGGTAGYIAPSCSGCDGIWMVSADVHSSLLNSTSGASINLQGSVGYGKDPDVSGLSVSLGVPFAYSMTMASKSRFSAFVTPGFGWGRVSASGANESGTRPLIGAGAGWYSAAGWGLQAGYQKVIIDGGGDAFGLGFSYNLK